MSNALASEGRTAAFIGNAVIALSFFGSLICLGAFGKVSVQSGPFEATEVWGPVLVSIYVAAGVNGALFGYLLAKVGSILTHLGSNEPPVVAPIDIPPMEKSR